MVRLFLVFTSEEPSTVNRFWPRLLSFTLNFHITAWRLLSVNGVYAVRFVMHPVNEWNVRCSLCDTSSVGNEASLNLRRLNSPCVEIETTAHDEIMVGGTEMLLGWRQEVSVHGSHLMVSVIFACLSGVLFASMQPSQYD